METDEVIKLINDERQRLWEEERANEVTDPAIVGQIRTDLLTRKEFDRNCARYAEWAYYMPPDRFVFHYYEDGVEEARICERPMLGMERYVVSGVNGGHYGIYDTRDVTFYLKTGTWIEIPSDVFFAQADVDAAQKKLDEAKQRLKDLK